MDNEYDDYTDIDLACAAETAWSPRERQSAAAELARREQAQVVTGCPACGFGFRATNTASLEKGECAKCGANWPLHGKQAQAEAQPSNIHQYKAALANFEQKVNDLRRENARLRALLAACVSIAEAAMNGQRITVPMCDAIAAAKEATR